MSLPRETLARYITPGCFWVETGTRWGDTTIEAVRLGASHAVTIEHDRIFAALASQHIEDALRARAREVYVNFADSAAVLRHMLSAKNPTVIFLDAHTEHESRVLGELMAVKDSWEHKPTIILIDDVRLFRSRQWGISLDDVLAAVRTVGDYEISYDTGIQPEDVLVARLR